MGKTVSSIVVLTGGGIKGAVCAARASREHEVTLLHVDYGQASASAESAAIAALAERLPAAQAMTVDLSDVSILQRQARSVSGTGAAAEELPRSNPAASLGLLPLLLSTAAQCTLGVGASLVVVGLSRMVDATRLGLSNTDGRPDRLRELLHAYNVVLDTMLSPQHGVSVNAPLMDLTYAQIVLLAERFQVPLDLTWSCERAGARPCGRCPSCAARARALGEAALIDPLINPVST